MIKKLAIACLIAGLCITTAGCSGISKEYDVVKKTQAEVIKQNSCHMVISSKVNSTERTDAIVTDFTYKLNDKGVMEYCHSQQDAANKLVYCEFSDGEKAEQWLIGNGWSVIEPVSYTKENPHRYIQLLTSAIDKKAISSMTANKEETNTRYDVTLNAAKLNKTTYKDAPIEVVSQDVSFLVNAKGELICYNDKAVIFDKETKSEAEYSLEVQLSDHNAISEVKKPELRANSLVLSTQKPDIIMPKEKVESQEVKPKSEEKATSSQKIETKPASSEKAESKAPSKGTSSQKQELKPTASEKAESKTTAPKKSETKPASSEKTSSKPTKAKNS